MFFQKPLFYFVSTFYDGEADAAAAQAAAAAAQASADAKVAADAKTAAEANKNRTYTQAEFEAAIQAEKNAATESTRKVIDQLEVHKKNSTLSATQQAALQKQIDELNSQVMTKEQLSKQEKDRLVNSYEEKVKAITDEATAWKTRFATSTVQRALTDAAIQHEGYDPEPFLALLGPKTEIVEEKDDAGNTKDFKVQVKFNTTDKDGKPTVMVLDPTQAVKQMKDDTAKYGYLFKGNTNAGMGQQGSQNLKTVDLASMGPEEYAKHRANILR